MNDKPEIKPKGISPLKHICMTIGELPSSYLETMTYYEMLLWFTKFLQERMIPALDNNALAVEELQNLFIELQSYVNNYFDNLDVQDEINNKLDQMLEDGVLEQIIEQFIQSTAIWTFNTLNDLKSSTNLIDGSFAEICGYNEINDGGNTLFKITESQGDIELDNGLYATPIQTDHIRVKDFGAIGDGETDDTDAIQLAIDYASKNGKAVVFERNKTYIVDSTKNHIAINGASKIERTYGALILKGDNITLIGNNATIKNTITQQQYNDNDSTLGAVILIYSAVQRENEIGESNNYNYLTNVGQNITINNLIIDGGSENINQSYLNYPAGTNHCIYARGISYIGQPTTTINLNNTSIKNTIAEGISGGGFISSINVKGGYFENSFPSCINGWGSIAIYDGCIIKNPMAIEFNPSYANSTQIVRNCDIKCVWSSSYQSTAYCIGGNGLISTNPNENGNIIMYNNIIDLDYYIQPTNSVMKFYTLNNLIFTNNLIKINARNNFGAGYGQILTLGNTNNVMLKNNTIKINYNGTTQKTNALIKYNQIADINNKVIENNIFEVVNTLNLSGSVNNSSSDIRNITSGFELRYHFTADANTTNLINRLYYMDNVKRMLISSKDNLTTLSNLDLKGYNASNGYNHLLPSVTDYVIPKQGRYFDLIQGEPNAASSEFLQLVVGTALESVYNFDISFWV